MTEQEERERLKAKALADIEYIKKHSEKIQDLVRINIGGIENIDKVDSVLETIATIQPALFDTGTLKDTQLFVTNFIGRFAKAVRAFNQNYVNDNTKTELLEASQAFLNAVNPMNSTSEKQIEKSAPTTQKNIMQILEEINDKTSDSDRLVQLQKKIDELNAKSEETSKLQNEINEIKESIIDLQSTEAQIEIRGFLKQAKELLDKANGSENLLNGEIQELKQAKEGHIAYNLSKELQLKSDDLKKEYKKKIGSISWKPWEFTGFYGAIAILLLVNLISWVIYFNAKLEIEFWHFMMLKLTINIPLIIYVGFALNEYTKAKKLYEEFDYKRILAQTLMNNYNQFKTDFTDDKDKLLDLIKAPLEKIFDNPVHSIYGDKSGDKNIGLNQLEKFASIFEKLKNESK